MNDFLEGPLQESKVGNDQSSWWMGVAALLVLLAVALAAWAASLWPTISGNNQQAGGTARAADGPILIPVSEPEALFADTNTVVLSPAEPTTSSSPSALMAIAFSPDGSMVAAAGTENVVSVWDMFTGEEIGHLTGAQARIEAIAWSPDSALIAGGGKGDLLHIWEPLSGPEPVDDIDHHDEVTAVVWSPDGSKLATGSEKGRVRTWRPGTAQHVAQMRNPSRVNAVRWPADGKSITVAHNEGFRTWDPTTGEVSGDVSLGGTLTDIAWSPDGRRQIVADQDPYLRLYGTGVGITGRPIRAHDDNVTAIAWSPDGRLIATGAADNTIVLWRAIDRKILAEFEGHADQVIALAWSADSTQLAVAGNSASISVRQVDPAVLTEAVR